MPPDRKPENRPYPRRWIKRHGAIFYRVPPGLESLWDGKKWFRLGATDAEAYRTWADRVDRPSTVATVGDLLDRYLLEVVPTKAPTTQAGNRVHIKRLRPVFGSMPVAGVVPRHVYKYVDLRPKKVAAHREVETLSHALTKAVEWGYIDRHPFKGEVRLAGEKPRDRYVTDEEVVACLSLAPARRRGSVLAIHAYIRIKLLTGLRRGDLLRLRVADLCDDGVHVRTGKTGKRVIYAWSDELRAAVDDAKAARPVDISPWLFCNKRGEGYVCEEKGTAAGWKSMWQRFMGRVLAETQVMAHFTEHDLRAKCASDAASLEHARALLAHADARTTDRIYRRRPERVAPLR